MNKEKKPKRKKLRIFLITLLLGVVVFSLYAGYLLLTLPDVAFLKNQNPKTTAIIEQRKKEAKQEGKKLVIRQKWISFEKIPELLKHTVRISEDAAFYQHNGIDYFELKEAIKRNLKEGKKARGASTITQQLAKNLFLSTEKSYSRKAKEFFIAQKLEKHLSKNRIFSLYLNIIELGKGIFGVAAASEYYFNKPVEQLTLVEIVRLVSVIPKPLKVTPVSDSRYLKWRANLLLDRLIKYDYITEAQYTSARKNFQ